MKNYVTGVLFVLLLISISLSSKAACTSSTGEWIVCESNFLQFLQDAQENCDGEIVGDVLILDGC